MSFLKLATNGLQLQEVRVYLHKGVLTEKTLLNVLNLIANAKTICALAHL
jgi:hypothetical protein